MTEATIVAIVEEDLRCEEWRDLVSERSEMLRGEVRLAKRLHRWILEGKVFDALAGSMAEFGERLGLGPVQVHCLYSVGCLLEKRPELEPLLLSGDLNIETADQPWGLLHVEGAVWEGEDWVALALEMPTADFRKKVERRLAEVAAGGMVRHMGFFVPVKTAHDFQRARTLASRKEQRPLTNAETLGVVVSDYLRRNDPMWREPSKRRRRPSLAADHVAAAVKLEVRRRFGDRCAVDGCTNEAHLEFAHILARALGGSNTAGNLLLLCSRHHRMFDARRIFLRGNHSERRRFVDRDGRFVAWLRDAPGEHPAATGPPG